VINVGLLFWLFGIGVGVSTLNDDCCDEGDD
jgi:hypothetical protein